MDTAPLDKLRGVDPLHLKLALQVAVVVSEAFPKAKAIAYFDTTFHESLVPADYTYAIPAEWREKHGIRTYGFHGFAHDYSDSRVGSIGEGPSFTAAERATLGASCQAQVQTGGYLSTWRDGNAEVRSAARIGDVGLGLPCRVA